MLATEVVQMNTESTERGGTRGKYAGCLEESLVLDPLCDFDRQFRAVRLPWMTVTNTLVTCKTQEE